MSRVHLAINGVHHISVRVDPRMMSRQITHKLPEAAYSLRTRSHNKLLIPKTIATLVIDTLSLDLSIKLILMRFYILNLNLYVDTVIDNLSPQHFNVCIFICALTCTQLRLTTVLKK